LRIYDDTQTGFRGRCAIAGGRAGTRKSFANRSLLDHDRAALCRAAQPDRKKQQIGNETS
jgi:hypothetical protein